MTLESNKYPRESTIVDISHHNSDINFDEARNHVSYFIARTGDGLTVIDRKYKKFTDEMAAKGIPFGNYMFNRFRNTSEARREAEHFWNIGNKKATTWVCDAEVSTAPNMQQCIQVFCDRLRELGAKKVGLYIGHHKYGEFGGANIKGIDFVWIPRYGNTPSYKCDIWQWTEYGNIPGIGKCDINVLYGDKSMEFFTSTGKVEIIVDKYNKVVTYQFGTNLAHDMVDILCSLGYKADLRFDSAQGLCHIETEHRQGNDLDKLTSQMDAKDIKYFYTQSESPWQF